MGFLIFKKIDNFIIANFESIIISFCVIGLFSDLIKKLIYRYYYILPGHIGISSIPKGLFGLFLLYSFFRFGINKRFFLLIVIWIVLILVGQYYYITNVGWFNLSGNVAYLLKYIFPIIAYCVLSSADISNERMIKMQKYFELLLKVNVGFIVFGFLFTLEWFKTYGSSRFGYSGFIEAQNEASLFMLIGIAYWFWKYTKFGTDHFWFVAYLFSNIILGTKIGILNAVVYSAAWLYLMRGRLVKGRLIHIALICIFLLPLLYLTLKGSFFNILEKSDIWTALSSVRNQLFFKHIDTISGEWVFQNYLFGGANFNRVLFEMDFFDLFYFGGFFGLLLFVYIYYELLSEQLEGVMIIFIILFIIGGGLAGHYFASGVNAFYVALFFYIVSRYKSINSIHSHKNR